MVPLAGEHPRVAVPLVTQPRTAATELIRIRLTKLATPPTKRCIGHGHATFQQEFFSIPEAKAEAKVHPHGVADDLGGKTVVLIARAWGCGAHAATVSHRLGVK